METKGNCQGVSRANLIGEINLLSAWVNKDYPQLRPLVFKAIRRRKGGPQRVYWSTADAVYSTNLEGADLQLWQKSQRG